MSETKKFFWLKLKRDFFKRHDIMVVEGMPNGKDYILFYLKLLCESVDHEGNLRFSTEIPYNEQMLSRITDTNVDIVRTAIKIFCDLGMMEILDDGTFFMRETQKMLGFETEWAKKQRDYRARKRQEKDNVLSLSDKSKSLEIEKENNKSINTLVEKNSTLHEEIISYLNEKTGKHYRANSKSTVRHINGRLKDGYTVDDFKKIIDTKTKQWLNDKRMSSYLRPETLFCAEHFESYLNECDSVKDTYYEDLSRRLAEETDKRAASISEEDYDEFM